LNRATIDLWVGIFVFIGIGAIVFLALKVGNLTSLQTTPTYRLEAAFDNIGGNIYNPWAMLHPAAEGAANLQWPQSRGNGQTETAVSPGTTLTFRRW